MAWTARLSSLLPWRQAPQQAQCTTALSCEPALEAAIADLAQQLRQAGQRGPADLGLVFCSSAYASDLQRFMPLLKQAIGAQHWLGCCGGGVVGTNTEGLAQELEHQPAISVTLLTLPQTQIELFSLNSESLPDLDGSRQSWIDWAGVDPNGGHSMLLLLDPTCTAINDVISGLDFAYPEAQKIGGIAGQHSAQHGSLLIGDDVVDGAVGCLIKGDWRLDPVVAQGCKPIGPVFEIEQAERNVLLRLSHDGEADTPVACLQTILKGLSPEEKELVRHSLFLGVAKTNFQLPSDGAPATGPAVLVRNLIGVDPRTGSVAVAERLRVGQQVQFQLRDAETSRQEQQQLLGQQRSRNAEPMAALLFACLGRGEGLYGGPNGDVDGCREQFPDVPISGAFCNGEIGPVAGATHLHGYTASWGFLVPNTP